MTVYYDQNIEGESYQKMLTFFQGKADLVAIVTREDIGVTHRIKQFLVLCEAHLIDEEVTNSWFLNKVESYKLVGHVYYYDYNEEMMNFLLNYADTLFDWGNQKGLPEDLTFLTIKKKFLFGANGHECYFEVDDRKVGSYLLFSIALMVWRGTF